MILKVIFQKIWKWHFWKCNSWKCKNLKCKSIDRLRHRQISNSFWCFINWIAKSQKEIVFTLPSVTLFLLLHPPSLKNQFKNSFPHSKIYLIKKESNYYTLCQNNLKKSLELENTKFPVKTGQQSIITKLYVARLRVFLY